MITLVNVKNTLTQLGALRSQLLSGPLSKSNITGGELKQFSLQQGLVVLATAGFVWRGTHAIACLTTKNLDKQSDVASLESITKIEECGPNQACYVEKFIYEQSPEDVRYRAGCRDVKECKLIECSNTVTEPIPTRRTRRSDDINLCSECCYSDVCNMNGCNATAINPDTALYHKRCFECTHIKPGDNRICQNMVWCEASEVCAVEADYTRFEYNVRCAKKSDCDAALAVQNVSGVLALKCFSGHLENFNPESNHNNTPIDDIYPIMLTWEPWSRCSASCGGGTRYRTKYGCVKVRPGLTESESCNTFCNHGHQYTGGKCQCPAWRSGRCCETCRPVNITNCISGQQKCGGCPDNVMCTKCQDPYFSAGYGKGCQECPTISNCEHRYCTSSTNTTCLKCADGHFPEPSYGATCNECAPIQHCSSSRCTNISDAKCVQCVAGYSLHNTSDSVICIPTKACDFGMTGPSCDVDIDECLEGGRCPNNTKCINIPGSYICDKQECASNPCQNGGLCEDLVWNFECKCKTGFTGRTCELDENECLHNPCRNNGSCVNTPGSFTCQCKNGYRGILCEVDIIQVPRLQCQNNGTPKRVGGILVCSCPVGFTGSLCETQINRCNPNPCLNGGSCEQLPGTYHCHCALGFAGTNCDKSLDPCRSKPCKNGGHCHSNLLHLTYYCQCSQTFTGQHCDVDMSSSQPVG